MSATPEYVKIHADREHAPGLYEVVKDTGREYILRAKGNRGSFTMYKAHTYQDLECHRAMRGDRNALAAKILDKFKK